MTPSRRHILLCSCVLALLTVLTALFMFSDSPDTPAAVIGQTPTATDAPRLSAADKATLSFFQKPSAPAKNDRSLFETDFFKPPPTPKPAPVKVAPVPVRTVSVVYRGLVRFPNGANIAYLSVDGSTAALATGDPVKDGWALDTFDSDEAVLVQGEQRVSLRFNRPATLPAQVPPPAADKK